MNKTTTNMFDLKTKEGKLLAINYLGKLRVKCKKNYNNSYNSEEKAELIELIDAIKDIQIYFIKEEENE